LKRGLDRVRDYYLYALLGCEEHESSPMRRYEPARDMPGWFLSLMDVAVAIASLPTQEQIAVGQRWGTWVDLDQARRALAVEGKAELVAKRKRDGEAAKHHRDRQAWIAERIGQLETGLARFDRSRSYKEGISKVLKKLKPSKRGLEARRIALECSEPDSTDTHPPNDSRPHSVRKTGNGG
jgi:hypothetical protein